MKSSARLGQQFTHVPHMIRYARSHRGRYSQTLVNAAEIIKREPAGYSSPVVLPRLRESICETCEGTRVLRLAQLSNVRLERSAIEVQMRSGSGWPKNWDHLHGLQFSGAVTRFAIVASAVDLDELREACEPTMQRGRDCGAVRRKSIGSDLERSARSGGADAFNEAATRTHADWGTTGLGGRRSAGRIVVACL